MASEGSAHSSEDLVVVSGCSREVVKLPLVDWARKRVAHFYATVKNSNAVVNKVFQSVERASAAVVEVVSPLVGKLSKPLGYLDGFVCGVLRWLQDKVPMVKAQPQNVYDSSKKPFSKFGSALKTTAEFTIAQVSKLPELPLRVLQSTESCLDEYFPMEIDKYENDASSEASSRGTVRAPGNVLVRTAESIGRTSFKLARAGFLVATSPLRWPLSLLRFQCAPPQFMEEEMIIYTKAQSRNSSSKSSDQESDEKNKSV